MQSKIQIVMLVLALVLILSTGPALAQLQSEEKQLEQRLQQQLEAVLGPGRARVSVSGQQETGSQQRSLTRSNPQVAAEREQTRSLEQAGTTQTQRTSQTSWTYDQVEELRQQKPSGLSQKSVSVVYDPPAIGEDEGEQQPLDPRVIEEIVRHAANLDETRGDRLSVTATRFAPKVLEQIQREGTPWWVLALIGLLGMLLGTGTGLWWMRRRQKQHQASQSQTWAQDWQAPTPTRQPVTGELMPIEPPGSKVGKSQ